jgi:hypothetical protein
MSAPDGSHFFLTVNNSRYHIFNEAYDFESRFPLRKSILASFFGSSFVREPLNDIVERTFHNGEVKFPLLTPWRNTVNFIASTVYASVTPLSKTLFAVKWKNSYAIVLTPLEHKYVALEIYVFFENDWETYSIIATKKNDASRQILRKLADTLYIN